MNIGDVEEIKEYTKKIRYVLESSSISPAYEENEFAVIKDDLITSTTELIDYISEFEESLEGVEALVVNMRDILLKNGEL